MRGTSQLKLAKRTHDVRTSYNVVMPDLDIYQILIATHHTLERSVGK